MSEFLEARRLGDPSIAQVILGQSPPSSAYNDAGDGLPFFQGKADFGLIHPTPRMWCNAGQRFAKAGDVLISVRAPVGDVNVATTDCVIGRGLAAVRAGPEVDPWFLYFALLHSKPIFEARATGSTFASINKANLHELEIPFANLPEQRAIASVLRLVVEKLEQEGHTVETAQEIKRAAMRELFTRGLRGEPQKDTEIGPVPESWNVATINDVALRTQYGLSIRGQAHGRFPILRMNCQDDGRVVFRDLQFVDLDDETLAAFRLQAGDLLFNRTNSIDHVGRTAIFDDTREAVFASYLIRLSVDRARCLPRYLNYYMNRPEVQNDIKRLASRAVGQANINAVKLRTIAFPLPPSIDEQREIVAILDAIDRKIDLHRRKKQVLEELFKALLHKLMTGEIRVADLDLSALEPLHTPPRGGLIEKET